VYKYSVIYTRSGLYFCVARGSSGELIYVGGHAMAQFVGFSGRGSGFVPGSVDVGFVVDKVALGQVFSEFFGFRCQYHSTLVFHTHVSSGG
jgi:hypothetical protein